MAKTKDDIIRFEYTDHRSSKFWQVHMKQNSAGPNISTYNVEYMTSWGKIGCAIPRTTEWHFGTNYDVNRLIKSKVDKGYSQVSITKADPVETTAKSKNKNSSHPLFLF